jgi:uncharacterized repeat protein (TIGR03806 family)
MMAIKGKSETEKGRRKTARLAALLFPFAFLVFAPAPRAQDPPGEDEPPEKLSSYGLFAGNGSTQEPMPGVVPYDLNTPLFSDHAVKYRFIKLPAGTSAKYHDSEVFDFPVGTTISKTFAFLNDITDPSKGRRLIETRLLIHKPEGWIGLPYIWNDEQTEATLEVAGGTCDVSWIHTDGKKHAVNYIVPNVNQCLGCHENNKVMRPIGPKARNLNRELTYKDGPKNQLDHWTAIGYLQGAPAPSRAPRLPVWNDPATGTLEERAMAWMEMNCAHCHNEAGPARTSGLDLQLTQKDLLKRGFWKTPVAAGRGTGGRSYDIVPGKPDESILMFRIQSAEPGIAMPESAHRLVDEEGVALVRQWIAALR